jgi:hypothetical protein
MSSRAANPVIHLELHTGDLRGAVEFYTRLFDWRPERIQAGAGSYLALGMGKGVGGGVVECQTNHPLWLPYVDVPDVGVTTTRAEDLGGKILLGPREGPEGFRSVVETPDGGEVAFWQSKTER